MIVPLPAWLNPATVDFFIVGCSSVFVLVGMCIRALTPNQTAFRGNQIIGDMLKGSSFFPFIMLAFCFACPDLIDLLKATNKAMLSFSGVMASIYVLSDFVKDAQGKRNGNVG